MFHPVAKSMGPNNLAMPFQSIEVSFMRKDVRAELEKAALARPFLLLLETLTERSSC
jgi:hypothetical protein